MLYICFVNYMLSGKPEGLSTQRVGDLLCPALRDCPLTSDLQNANHFANRPTVSGNAGMAQYIKIKTIM